MEPRCSKQLTEEDTSCFSGTVERWRFNPMYGQCRPFLGCPNNNGNNWQSQYNCESMCKQGNNTEMNDHRCTTDPTLGQWLCLYKEERYYWDTGSSTCRSFYGCPYRNRMGYPTGNNFGSVSSCMSLCASPTAPPRRDP